MWHDFDAGRELDPLDEDAGLCGVAKERRDLGCAGKPFVLNVGGKFVATQRDGAALHIGMNGCGHEPVRQRRCQSKCS